MNSLMAELTMKMREKLKGPQWGPKAQQKDNIVLLEGNLHHLFQM
jgi:hypothetical protein